MAASTHGGLAAGRLAALPAGFILPSGLRCPVFAVRDGARLQKTDRVPLALSQFSQRRLPVSSTGCGRRRCPCSASPVSAAGSGSAAQPPAHRGTPMAAPSPPDRGSGPIGYSLQALRSAEPEGAGIGFRPRFSSIGIVSAKVTLQLKSRRSSPRYRAPVWGRARRAEGTSIGWRADLDHSSSRSRSPARIKSSGASGSATSRRLWL